MLADMIREACRGSGATWSVRHESGPELALSPGGGDPGWIRAVPAGARIPDQGWKLHITSYAEGAPDTLRRCLPVLTARATAFKVADLALLSRLNGGEEGVSQIGKFITVYPPPGQAPDLAVELDEATRGTRGPIPPSDRPLSWDSVVSYRYGSFTGGFLQTAEGRVLPARLGPGGSVEPDARRPYYTPPPAPVPDPFPGRIGREPPRQLIEELLDGRYLLVTCLSRTPRGNLYEAIEVSTARDFIVKHAPRDRLLHGSGADSRDLLRNEAVVLRGLQPDPRFPKIRELVEVGRDLCLVQERLPGETLDRRVAALAARGEWIGRARLIRWARELAAMLLAIERRGWVYTDVKSANIIVTPQDELRLVDFETCHRAGTSGRALERGTRGYLDPHNPAGSRRSRVYAYGAVLYFMATAAEPSWAPGGSLLKRPVGELNPEVDPDLVAFVERCLTPDGAARFDDLAVAAHALGEIPARVARARVRAEPPAVAAGPPDDGDALQTAYRLADSLCASARQVPGGESMSWWSPHDPTGALALGDVNTGTAGIVLALAEVARSSGDATHLRVLAGAAPTLTGRSILRGPRLPGLYVGQAGRAAALLLAGQVLADQALVESAARLSAEVAGMPYTSPDLFNGTAGRLRLHLMMWDATSERVHRDAAAAAADELLGRMDGTGAQFAGWPVPAGYAGLSGRSWLGYAHGVAGIADALLDAYEEFSDDRYAAAVADAVRLLGRTSAAVPADGPGVGWPTHLGSRAVTAPFWCHGAAGIGTFLLRAARHRPHSGAMDLARRAGRTVARGASWAGPARCHGLAGNIEFLLDLHQATAEHGWLPAARRLARVLNAFRREVDGHLVWGTDMPGTVDPSYLTGYAGIAVCLLRLAEPGTRPPQLVRRGFPRA